MTTIGRSALAVVNLLIAQGADNEYSFRYLSAEGAPVDMTGYTARAQIRNTVRGDLWLELTDIDLGSDGTITVTIGHDITEHQVWAKRHGGVWDLELVDPNGKVLRFVEGKVTVSHEVTRDDE